MLEDIYPRLLSEVLPSEINLSTFDIRRMLEAHQNGEDFNRSYGQFVKSIYLTNPESNVGLHLGKYLLPSKLCDFSRVLVTARTGREVLSLVERMYYIQGACYHPFVSNRNGRVRISLVYPYRNNPPEAQRRFCAETAFSYLINGIRETIAPDFKANFIHFDFPKPRYIEEYPGIFGDQLHFNQGLSMIEFEDHYLNIPLTTHNPTLHHMYLNKYMDFARDCERYASFEYKAISYLMLHHPEALNSQNLASRLNISVRGLQKRLSKSGKSFSCIANRCRKELAKVYLVQEQQSIDFTAEQLGFQTSSGFRRFFKTEFDTTPAEYLTHTNGAKAATPALA